MHLLKMVWRRKRANALVMLEIFVSFLIVFAVMTMAASLVSRWRAPLGFSWQNVWTLEIESARPESVSGDLSAASDEQRAHQVGTVAGRIVNELKTLPQVEAAAADSMAPYSGNQWQTIAGINGKQVLVNADQASDDFARVMKIPILRGRWFSAEDEAQNYSPIVLDADAAQAMFGTIDAVGQKFTSGYLNDQKGQTEYRVVGVIPSFRQAGEFSDRRQQMVFIRASFIKPASPEAARVVFRVRPGTPAAFEAELNDRLRRVGAVSFRIVRMEEMRASELRQRFVPVVLLTLVAVFLISMVALGLTGVLWQTVTRRMREFGLRRAVGANGSGVRAQVLGEVALLSTLSVVAGAIVIVQLPIIGVMRVITPAEFAAGFATALAVIYGITLLCGAYPSWLASTIEPAEALRYE